MIYYDDFLVICKQKGLDPLNYLIPSNIYEEIDDEAEYLTEDISYFINKSERQTRRWLQYGYIKPFSKRPYKCYGIEIKRTLFVEFHNQIMTNIKGI